MPLSSLSARPAMGGPFRVMIVEDSAVIRGMYTKNFETDAEISVICSAGNGQVALEMLKRQDVDVIILDIEMPVMDGMTALPKLLEIDSSVQILMSSTLTKRNAEISILALQMGAKDYLSKPSSTGEMAGAEDFKRDMIAKTKALATRRRKLKGIPMPESNAPAKPQKMFTAEKLQGKTSVEPTRSFSAPGSKTITLRKAGSHRPEILAIGSSTGGPNALFAFFKSLDKNLNMPVVLTQHMPPNFTAILAEHISKLTGWNCKEAISGDMLENNKILLAPGDFHMTVVQEDGKRFVRLNQDPAENFCRPSVDPMLRSLIPIYGPKILMVMLTGMGADGLGGSRKVIDAGGTVIAQDEASSVVWGMPGAVAGAGLCSAVLPLDDMGGYVTKLVKG